MAYPRLTLTFAACSLLLPGCDLFSIESGNLAIPGGISCTDFRTQEEAQAHFDEHGGPSNLDPDGDGIACN